nr:MAG TPA: hypothetical protein [Caudoviricetes sp.]
MIIIHQMLATGIECVMIVEKCVPHLRFNKG